MWPREKQFRRTLHDVRCTHTECDDPNNETLYVKYYSQQKHKEWI